MFSQRPSAKNTGFSGRRCAGPSRSLRLALIAALAAASVSAQTAKDCASLTAVTTEDATITSAASSTQRPPSATQG